jgi:type II secretory pathway pseudopilin PulG
MNPEVALHHHTGASKLPRNAGGLGAPKRPRSEGGLVAPKRLREGGFTLMEIAIVAVIVGLLSTLAVATVRHLQQRAARSTILNNLRQLHEAKEHYFLESGGNLSTPRGLAQNGYLRQSVSDRVTSGATFEAHLGWHYGYFLMPGQPTYAHQGTDPGTPAGKDQPGVMNWSQPTGEVIWYPAPPAELAAAGAGSGSAATAAVQLPAVPPVAQPTLTGPPQIAVPRRTYLGRLDDRAMINNLPEVKPNDPNAGRFYYSFPDDRARADGGFRITAGPAAGLLVPIDYMLVNTGDPNYGHNGYVIMHKSQQSVVAPRRDQLPQAP